MLRLRGIDRPKPRSQFVKDLSSLLTDYHTCGSDILLMGDFNEVIGLDPNGMSKVLQAGHLTDTQVFRHGIDNEASTYSRGPNRVDYIFASARLLPHLYRQGCEPFNARIFSDHRGLFIDLAYPGLFDRSPNLMAPCLLPTPP